MVHEDGQVLTNPHCLQAELREVIDILLSSGYSEAREFDSLEKLDLANPKALKEGFNMILVHKDAKKIDFESVVAGFEES